VRIIADSADETYFMPQIVRMPGKVERRAAQVLRGWKDVPEHLANGDDLHKKSVSGRRALNKCGWAFGA
jgi:hypothetical protein